MQGAGWLIQFVRCGEKMTEHKTCLEYDEELDMCEFGCECPHSDDWNSAFKYCDFYCESD